MSCISIRLMTPTQDYLEIPPSHIQVKAAKVQVSATAKSYWPSRAFIIGGWGVPSLRQKREPSSPLSQLLQLVSGYTLGPILTHMLISTACLCTRYMLEK